jgi:cation transport protein ChaC
MNSSIRQNRGATLLHGLVENGKFDDICKLPEVWVFGYGSLVWLPKFEFSEKRVGKIYGWQRRFYQGNSTHRGVPGKPGRVATLLKGSPTCETYGCAYKLTGIEILRALEHLNMRESTLGGYILTVEMFYCIKTDKMCPVLLYTATSTNDQFTGAETISELARVIAFSTGASGTNREYLFRLVDWQRNNLPDIQDDHLYSLDKATRAIIEGHINGAIRPRLTPVKTIRRQSFQITTQHSLLRSTE